MKVTPDLQSLLQSPHVWRGGEQRGQQPTASAIPTGFPVLDKALPGGGWPRGALTEILHAHHGLGEVSLVLPAITALNLKKEYVAWIAPPFPLCAPALDGMDLTLQHNLVITPDSKPDGLWALEQVLRHGSCAAALAWLPSPSTTQLRRLQLAAEAGHATAFLFRSQAAARQASPAALRILFSNRAQQHQLDILKCRGRFFKQPLLLAPLH